MNTEIFGVVTVFLQTIVLAIPVGKYIAKVYLGEKTFLDFIFNPIERFIFKISGINDKEEMNWKQHLKALLSVNLGWFILCFTFSRKFTTQPRWKSFNESRFSF